VGQCPTWWSPFQLAKPVGETCWTFCSTPQSLADAHYYRLPRSNAAKTRNQLKFAEVSQTPEPMSAVSGPKFTILWRHVEDILLLNNFFSIVDTCLSCEDIARRSCAMVPLDGDFWRLFCVLHFQRAACSDFFASCILASRMQHASDLHLKFALRPRHVWKYGRHPICDSWD